MSQRDRCLINETDDDFHAGPDRWQSDGSWWGFYVPERRLGGWIYHMTRVNLGFAYGGVYIWDDSAHICWETPYFRDQSHQALAGDRMDLNQITWPDGVSLRTITPLQRYQLQYSDRDLVAFDLTYDAVAEPFVSAAGVPRRPFRMEQPCRVTGILRLHGVEIAVDSIGMRDHSWMVRPQTSHAKTALAKVDPSSFAGRPAIYLFANASALEGFFVSPFESGYLVRDGIRADLISPKQTVTRGQETGHILALEIEGRDELGRSLHAFGKTLSWILRPSNHGVALVHLMMWTFNGQTGWGDTQDVWAVDEWAMFRRWQRTKAAGAELS